MVVSARVLVVVKKEQGNNEKKGGGLDGGRGGGRGGARGGVRGDGVDGGREVVAATEQILPLLLGSLALKARVQL